MNYELRIREKGFTLIELLIVIVIIGILAAMILANFVGVRQRARDGRRKSDLRQIQSAVELYRADKGSYPSSVTCGGTIQNADASVTYLKIIPCDPSGSAWTQYTYSQGGGYTLVACLENANDSEADKQPPSNSCLGTGVKYTLTNP